ncbi:MAG: serine/threonine protein kinase [Myxococcales bacterium]|nr:serine/threonine protein kinase [Myxococcales bacterium]
MREPVKFGDYYLFERVAVGGMAEVFKGVSYGVEGFERLFAVKRVLPNISEDQEFIEMFIDEAKIAVQLTHANIGQIFELGNADSSYFIAMEFVQGKDLRAIFDTARRRGGALDVAMCCHVVKEVCEALEYAHNKRNERQQPLDLIHRDVSPQNILVSYDGEVKLIDFGIAKAAGKASKTQAGILKGKFGYMSPEQVRGKTIDRRSDLFSLAVVLYELLTLERCFQGESDFSTLEKVRRVDIRRPAEINRAIPPELEDILLKGLSRDPADRYQSASELQDALQKFLYQSGSFYARKDLAAYMRGTFGRELEAEQARMTAFREYARQHIPEAGRPGVPAPEIEVELPQEFVPDLPALSWEQDEVETSIWDRAPSALTAMPTGNDRAPEPPAPAVAPDPPAFGAAAREGALRRTAIDDELPTVNNNGQRPTALLSEVAPAVAPADLRLPPGVAQRPATQNRLSVFLVITLLALGGSALAVWLLGREPPRAALTINSAPPGARVRLTIDGRALAEQVTPVTVADLEPGSHTIRIEATDQETVDTSVDLQAGRTRTLEVVLQPRATTGLELNTEPVGARVFIDGEELPDRTPMRTSAVAPGKRHLRIIKDGYLPWEGTVEAAQGKLRRVETIELRPDKVAVTFQPDPPETRVVVVLGDGTRKELGEGVVTFEGLPNTGLARVEAEARGYEPLQRKLPQYDRRAVTELLTLEEVPVRAPATTPPPQRPPVRPVPRPRRPDPGRCEGEDCPPPGDVVAPPTRAPEPVAVPQPKGDGTLKLTAVPSARVLIDGKDMGQTPLLGIKLSVGNHQVELVRDWEPRPYRKTITVYIEKDKETFRRVSE